MDMERTMKVVSATSEFDCIDCGIHVLRFINHFANDQYLCAECTWLRSIEDPVEREKLRKFLNRGDDNGNREK